MNNKTERQERKTAGVKFFFFLFSYTRHDVGSLKAGTGTYK